MKKWLIIFIFLSLGISAVAREDIKRYDDANRPVFAGKGTWSVGGTASISAHNNSNFNFLIVEGINSNGLKISVTPEFCWFFKDNMAVGGKIGYSHYILNAESGSMKVNTLSLGVENYDIIKQSLNLAAFARFYIPIGESERVSLYADTGLQGVIGCGKESEQHTGAVVGTYQNQWKAGIFVNPGIMAYCFDKRIALFASLGIAGFNFSRTSQLHDQVDDGSRNSFSFNFTLNPVALNIGLNYFIGRK